MADAGADPRPPVQTKFGEGQPMIEELHPFPLGEAVADPSGDLPASHVIEPEPDQGAGGEQEPVIRASFGKGRWNRRR